jgi:hypothetical protein
MTTIAHEPDRQVRRRSWLDARDMWASIAISVIWLTVALTALFGPDFKSVSNDGNAATIPSGLGVALFAMFATMAVAKYGFTKKTQDS